MLHAQQPATLIDSVVNYRGNKNRNCLKILIRIFEYALIKCYQYSASPTYELKFVIGFTKMMFSYNSN